MTDNEIIQALECCNKPVRENSCTECAFYRISGCSKNMINATLDLINRQREEIERLEKEKDSKLVMCIANDKDKIKSEAIKDFSERLKIEIINDTAYGCDCNQHSGYYDYKIKIGDISEYIDDIIKEMTEVKE